MRATGPIWMHILGPICTLAGGVVHASDPWCGWSREKRRRTRKTYDTTCGRKRAVLFAVAVDGGGAMSIQWPPYVTEVRAEGLERCPDCFRLAPGRPNRMVER